VLDHPLGELVAGTVGNMLLKDRRSRSRLRVRAEPIENTRWARNE